MLIEITTFELTDADGHDAFLDADRRVQDEVVPNQRGFLRRTTARSDDGEWAVITLWHSTDDADTSAAQAADHPTIAAFDALLDAASVRTKRYRALD